MVLEAHIILYRSSIGLRVIQRKKKRAGDGAGQGGSLIAGMYVASCGPASAMASRAVLDVVDVPGLGFKV